jgi:V/A-type H+-transporting ATPase subunit I
MIIGMKKITVLESAKRRAAVTEGLNRLGVLHVHQTAAPVSAAIQSIEHEIERTNRAIGILGEAKLDRPPVSGLDPRVVVDRVLDASREKDRATRELEERSADFHWYAAWGSVSGRSIRFLRNHGVHVHFYLVPKKAYAELAGEHILVAVGEEGGLLRCAQITRNADDRLDLVVEPLPEIEYADLIAAKERLDQELAAAESVINAMRVERPVIEDWRQELEKRLEFARVRDGMAEDANIISLEGFCPVDRIEAFRAAADEAGWAYVIADPDDPEVTPTLIRSPKFVEIIAPVFKFMGTVPGYQEYDISVWFLFFLTLFFAMLVGDAAYGLIFLGIAGWVHYKFKSIPRAPLFLFYLFAVATVIWGSLTGTWFGHEPFAKLPILSSLVVPSLDSFNAANQDFIIFICFTIGAIHLTLAHALAGIRLAPSPKALSQLGWILTVWAAYFIAGLMVLNRPMPGAAMPMLVAGVVLAFLFSNIDIGFFRGLGKTAIDLPFGVIGAFADVVSYIRIFAVGLATVVVAKSFNEMGMELGAGSALAGALAAVVIFFGHAINIVLALMSVLVHGIRLNMLEFCGHLGMQWTGREYRPFKE